MQVKIVLNVRGMSKEDIRGFVQMIRDWELRTPKAEIVGVLFETDPEIFLEFDHLVGVPESKPGLLRLGRRGLVADGDLIGTCDELTLTVAEASEGEISVLQEAENITLVRIRGG